MLNNYFFQFPVSEIPESRQALALTSHGVSQQLLYVKRAVTRQPGSHPKDS